MANYDSARLPLAFKAPVQLKRNDPAKAPGEGAW
jgi:hypothetical protein